MGLAGLQGWNLFFLSLSYLSPFSRKDWISFSVLFELGHYIHLAWASIISVCGIAKYCTTVFLKRGHKPEFVFLKKKHLTLSCWYFFTEYHLISPDPSPSQPANRASFRLPLWEVEIEALRESRQAFEIDEAQTSGLDNLVVSCQTHFSCASIPSFIFAINQKCNNSIQKFIIH